MESEAAAYIQATWQVAPRVLVICGSGMGPLAEALEDTVRISYKDIPHFPTTTIQGHQGELVMGYMNKIPTMCMLGRFHFYEGNEMERVVFPIRVAQACGASFVVVTNAAGGLNPEYKAGHNPLRGPNHPSGPRFVPLSNAYCPDLVDKAYGIAKKQGFEQIFKQGVYCMVSGPNYETPAECRFLRTFADAVGMSTAPEVIAANHCGMKVVGFSIVTNEAITQVSKMLDTHETVLEQASVHIGKLRSVIMALVTELK